MTYSLYWIVYKDITLFLKTRHANLTFDKHPSGEWFKLFVFKGLYVGYMLILPAFLSSFSWIQILTAFLIMHLLKSVFLLFAFLISHHVESTADHAQATVLTSWFSNQISTANDIHPFSKTANFIFGGFNCHIAHHLFPSLPHPYYPDISRIIYRHLQDNHFPVHQTSYIGGIISHLKLLKILSKELVVQAP
jgi:linoleoyl-CoA desaturase